MNDVVAIGNEVCDRQRWREQTVFAGHQWAPTPYGCTVAELRRESDGTLRARVVGRYRHTALDWWEYACPQCGLECERRTLDTGGGPVCCSDACCARYEEDAVTACEHCGAAKPTRFDVHGNHSCVLCASRAFRAHFEAERRDTIPAPPPTRDCHLETMAAPESSAA